jgi:hypothetical protein
VVLAAALTSTAFADAGAQTAPADRDGRWWWGGLGVDVGAAALQRQQYVDRDAGPAGGVLILKPMGGRVAGELRVSTAHFPTDERPFPGSLDLDVVGAMAGARVGIVRGGGVTVFAHGAVGIHYVRQPGELYPGAAGGAGIAADVRPGLAVEARSEYHHVFRTDPRVQFIGVHVGIRFRL